MDDNFWGSVKEQLQEFGKALLMLVLEGLFAVAVWGVSHGIAWVFHRYSADGDRMATIATGIGDIGSVLLFIGLVARDLFKYFRK
jgi:hypothetical protein